MRRPRRDLGAVTGVAALAATLAGCELQEVVIVEVSDVVVAEVHVQVGGPGFGADRIHAFLHRTVGGDGPGYQPVPGAVVTVTRDDGLVLDVPELPPDSIERCASSTPVGGTGTCYRLAGAAASPIGPGDRLQVRVDLPGGGVLTSATTVPGDFRLTGLPDGVRCLLPAATPLTVTWSGSEGAWAYVHETLIRRLGDALAPRGIAVEDPLYLLGLSVSASDTTVVFPGEFGLFNRFELDRDLAAVLQQGLPPATSATVMITAVDRNYVNWARGGNFNPSGLVKIPSVQGDGTGVFGSSVVRELEVAVDPAPTGESYGYPPCPE